MRKSKLESYQKILEALIHKPLTTDRLSYKVSMDCMVLRRRLDFLNKNGLVTEHTVRRKTVWKLTQRGAAVLNVLNTQELLIKVKKAILTLNEAIPVQVTPIASKRTH